MKKPFLLSLFVVSLALVGCTRQTPTINQNANQPMANINENVNQPNPERVDSSADSSREITTTIQASTTENNNGDRIHIETPVTQTINCGSQDCFEQKFSKCEKATMKASAVGAEYYYEIIGQEQGGCKMLTRYNTNPNPAWVGKNMICLYNNLLKLEEANKQVLNGVINGSIKCEGELFQVLSSLNK
ncbi:MAG: hypothetical protein AAB969_01895 [Patescibacteria group bacterium]